MDDTDQNVIHLNDQIPITDLIKNLCDLIDLGYTHIEVNSEIKGDGNNEDGSDEYEYIESQLIGRKL